MNIYKKVSEVDSNSSLVVGLFEGERILRINHEVDEYIKELINGDNFSNELGRVYTIHTFDKCQFPKVHIIGLGKRKDYNYNKQAEAYNKINYKLDKNITIDVNSFAGDLDIDRSVFEMVIAIDHNNYLFDRFKSKKQDNKMIINFLVIENVQETIQKAYNMSTAIKNTRDLVNLPYNHLNAEKLAAYAKDMVENLNNDKTKIKVFNKSEIEKLEMTAFLSVNKGSADEPFLIFITYQGAEETANPVSLVGKGLMYDTGGYSLKNSMNTMKCDMAGAATVLGVLEAVVKNNLPINVNVVIAATDNRISGGAYLPDDIIEAMNKKTIEIVSTDAEGRLTLADALTFAQKEGSKHVIDIATLTGAVGVALGEHTTGVFGNNKEMVNQFLKAAEESNESAWQLPITEHIKKQVRSSKVADLTNSTGRYMGASGAAAFLEEFIEEDTKWVHLDIAFTAFNSNKAGGTGVMIKSIYKYLQNLV